ncbi:MAG: PQQ-dependent dehydrogenase, methanol/ethanol family, partial [Pseudomonadota bacterium]
MLGKVRQLYVGISSALLLACYSLSAGSSPAVEQATPADHSNLKSAVEQATPTEHGKLKAMREADKRTDEWFTTGGQFSEKHHSSLARINQETVERLGFAWEYDLGSRRGVEATPVIVDGVIYASGPWGETYAVRGDTGEQVWRFRPEVDGQVAKNACCDVVNRGVAVWEDLVYVAALDGVLYALDRDTGEVKWQVDTFDGEPGRKASTGAPRVAGDVVVIGFGGADFNARGYITAYHRKTGEFAWRFYTVPGAPDKPYEHPELEMAAKTWDPDSMWEAGLGGTVWDSMVFDPEANLLYVGTGNAAVGPIKFRSPAGGDNLFLSSILAINPDTGQLVWHYQVDPGEEWDYTATQNMILAEIEIDGVERKVLMQAPKNGYFYVLDRLTGELISAEPFVPVNWSTHIDMKTGRPVLTEAANFSDEPTIMWPSTKGAHGWRAMTYSDKTGLVYIPAYESADLKVALFDEEFKYDPTRLNGGVLPLPLSEGAIDYYKDELPVDVEVLKEMLRNSDVPPERTVLIAWDPVKNETAWEIEMDYFRNSGGVLTTDGGLVFHTKPSGELKVYSDETGELLHSIQTGSGLMGSPATYEIDGEQYVVVLAGLGGGGFFSYPKFTAAYKYGNRGRMI